MLSCLRTEDKRSLFNLYAVHVGSSTAWQWSPSVGGTASSVSKGRSSGTCHVAVAVADSDHEQWRNQPFDRNCVGIHAVERVKRSCSCFTPELRCNNRVNSSRTHPNANYSRVNFSRRQQGSTAHERMKTNPGRQTGKSANIKILHMGKTRTLSEPIELPS